MENSIKRKVDELKALYGTSDPEEICKALGVIVARCELPKNTRGFCLSIKEGSAIMVNRNLKRGEFLACVAHELGHYILHKKYNYVFLSQNTVMVPGKFEREANVFAALLLTDSIDCRDYTLNRLSKMLCLPEDTVYEAINIR